MAKTKKDLIFEEAVKLFRDRGYPATSMRDLADKVGLKPSSLYSHITSKEEILKKICFDNAHKFIEGIDRVEAEESSPEAQLRALIHLHVRIATQDKTSVTVFNDEWRHLNKKDLKLFLKMRKDYEQRFLAIIEKGVQKKQFKKLDKTVALFTMLTSVRWIHYWYNNNRKISLAQLEKDIVTLLLDGLKA